jgi:hypothetical protein
MKYAEEPLDEGTAIFCVEMFGNGVVQRVSRMKGSYIFLEAKFLDRSQPWTGLKYRTIIASSHMIRARQVLCIISTMIIYLLWISLG